MSRARKKRTDVVQSALDIAPEPVAPVRRCGRCAHYSPAAKMCHEGPNFIRRVESDWCGRFKEKSLKEG